MALLPFVTNPYPTLAGAWYSLSLGPPGQYGSQGWSNFNDPTLNSLLDQAAQQLNPVTAAPIYAQADTVLWNDMVALPLFAEPVALGWSVYTNGVTTSLYQNGLFWNAEQWAVTVKEPSSYTGTPTIPAGQ
jgi:ABC-type transport system substrate-binding protein